MVESAETSAELIAVRKKLENKTEAVLMVSQELLECQAERDSLKSQAETWKERAEALQETLKTQSKDRSMADLKTEEQQQHLAQILQCLKRENRRLQLENFEFRQKVSELDGDNKLLHQKLARLRVESQSTSNDLDSVDSNSTVGESTDDVLLQLEQLKDKYAQLERDLKSILCEKEELVIDRDVYKSKVERLNEQLNALFNNSPRDEDHRPLLDIDSLLMENRYLKDKLKSAHEENGLAKQAISKYKNLLDKRKKLMHPSAAANPGSSAETDTPFLSANIITPKQVQELLDKGGNVDFRSVAAALLDAVNDKNLALNHQRKANKLLGNRVTELDEKLLSIAKESGSKSPIHLQNVAKTDAATQTEVAGNCNRHDSEESLESDDDASDSLDHSGDSMKHLNN